MKIYVTGLGVVSGIGIGVGENIDALRQQKHGIGKITLFPTALDVPASEVKHTNEELNRLLSIPPEKTTSRTALLGMLAAKEALEDAQLPEHARLRVGFISATSVGGMDLSEHFYLSFKENPNRGKLREIISHDCGASTEFIASYLGVKDYSTTISTACSSAANAIMLGARMIKYGQLDVVIAGGTDALCRFTLNGFNSLMILDKEHCRPFDESRAGLNLGEGAGYLVLQSEKTLSRTPYCELSGYANVNEAYHQTGSSPEGDGAYLSMNEAIRSAGIAKEEIDYINVHGTGTPSNDVSESKAIQRTFGEHLPAFSSVKAFIGHTLGASEGIEAVYSALSIHKGMVYPNLNFREAIPETGLTPITEFKEGLPIRHVLSNSFGFGGNNSTLIFSALDNGLLLHNHRTVSTMQPVYIQHIASIHPQGKNAERPYLTAFEPDYKSIITNATLRRRMSRIIKMGVACGLECITDLPSEQVQGIITATGLGCLTDTEKFMNTLIDNEERMLNPTPFIQSTFNTIGGQIALLRGIHAYNMTYVHRGLSFESALQDAIISIWEGKDHLLVGAIDEMTETSYAIQKRLGLLRGNQSDKDTQADKYIRRENCTQIGESIFPGEGAQFFLLNREPNHQTLAEIAGIETFSGQHSVVEISQRITAFLQKNGTEIRDIRRLVTGKTGNAHQDAIYNAIESHLFPQAIYQTFKDECGEYPTASAYALWKVAQSMENCTDAETVLIYNHHYSIHHSLMLIRKNV